MHKMNGTGQNDNLNLNFLIQDQPSQSNRYPGSKASNMELATLAFADYDHPDPNMPPETSPEPRTTKRRKVNLACEQCRLRKAKCDGTKPICSNCSRRKERCVYKVTQAQMDTTQNYVESLLSKISTLEEENTRLRAAKEIDERDIVTKMLSGPTQTPATLKSSISASGGPTRVSVPKRKNFPDQMNGATRTARLDMYHGASSMASLIEQVKNVIGDDDVENGQQDPFASLPVGIDNATFEADYASPENFSLFPRPVTDFLLRRYWDRTHTLYPFVHKRTFMMSYERLWDANAQPAPRNSSLGLGESGHAGPLTFPFHCALNAMMMIGLQFTSLDQQDKNNLTFQCLQKCKNLLKVDLFNEGSLAMLQTTLLLSHFFQSTSSPNKAWMITGLSCRIAQGLGLHVDGRLPDTRPPIVRELRRRVFYMTIILDMATAMTLGRPVMLRRKHVVPLPEPIDDEYLERNIPQPANHISDLLYFREMLKLHAVQREALAFLFKDSLGNDFQKIDKTTELDSKIVKVQQELPDVLKSNQPIPDNLRLNRKTIEQQRNVLAIRILAARAGLHRSLLSDYCKGTMKLQSQGLNEWDATTSLARRCQQAAAIVCLQQSLQCVNMINVHAGTEATSEWWQNLIFIHIAAAVLIMAKTQPCLLAQIGAENVEAGYRACREVLTHKLPQNEVVQSCLRGVEKLYEKVERFSRSSPMANGSDFANAAGATMQAFGEFSMPYPYANDSGFVDSNFFGNTAQDWTMPMGPADFSQFS